MIEVVAPGFFTSVQDSGRTGYRSLGVPVSGPMDKISFRLAQRLVGNSDMQAALECTLKGPTLKFHSKAMVVICGAPLKIQHNHRFIPMNTPFTCLSQDILTLGNVAKGMRSYAAFAGGLKTLKILESRSYFYPITSKAILKKGDSLELAAFNFDANLNKNTPKTKLTFEENILTATPGPEWELLPSEEQKKLVTTSFQIGSNSRMGYRLNGNLATNNYNLPSSAVVPGVVQLTPEGGLLALMADAQVTGGYPRVLVLTTAATSLLAQKRTGEKVSFKILEALKS